MSKKNKDIEVVVDEIKRNQGNTQILVNRLSIGKQVIGFVIPDEKGRYQVEKDGETIAKVKTLDEGFEELIADYNLRQ